METILCILCVCLLILFLVTLIRLITTKKQIKEFIKEMKKLKNSKYEKMISVNTFDKNIIELANQLNDHIKLQRELSVKYLNKSQQLKEIISGISHDFRTPLTAAKGYLQMLDKSEKFSQTEREYLNIAIHKTEYLKSLSDDFFELAVLESNNEEIKLENINISNLMTEFLLGQYYKIQSANLEINFNIPEKPVFVMTNIHMLNRILENLFSNAIKYAKTYIGVELITKNNTITISVINDVEDKNSIDISKVFEPFYRSQTRTMNGSGIGLYVVKNLSEKLNFDVQADFDKHKNFVITLSLSKGVLI